MTKLDRPLRREVIIDKKPYSLVFDPDGLKYKTPIIWTDSPNEVDSAAS